MKAPSEEIYSKSTICDFLLMVRKLSSNRGRITYRLRDICARNVEVKIAIFVTVFRP